MTLLFLLLMTSWFLLFFAFMIIGQNGNKIKTYETQINNLQDELNQLKLENYEKNEVSIKFNLELKEKKSELQQEIYQLQQEISELQDKLNNQNQKLETKKSELQQEISELEDNINLLQCKDLSLYTEKILFDDFNNVNSDDLKNELVLLKLEQKQLIQDNKAIKSVYSSYTHNAIERNNKKQLLNSFQSECTNIFQNLNFSNIDKSRDRLVKTFNNLNNIFKTDDINLSEEFLNLKLKEFNFLIEIAKKQQEEKETQKAIKEQLLEEEKVRKEIEKQKLKIAKEEKQFNNELSKMLVYLQKADNDIEKQIYADKIKELEEKIKLLEKDKQNVFQRESNTRAGFVYIVSNIGSFGENIFKIGMTRRLEPMDRISELSSASVPFPFDVHAIIFSDDAPSLENSLHKYFEDKSVNKVNLRKEFFKIDIKELKEYLLNNLDLSINFIDIPKAEQYRESLKKEKSNN